jgi:hypothetical protein
MSADNMTDPKPWDVTMLEASQIANPADMPVAFARPWGLDQWSDDDDDAPMAEDGPGVYRLTAQVAVRVTGGEHGYAWVTMHWEQRFESLADAEAYLTDGRAFDLGVIVPNTALDSVLRKDQP